MDRVTDEHSSTSIDDEWNGMDAVEWMEWMITMTDNETTTMLSMIRKLTKWREIVCWMKVRFEMQSMNWEGYEDQNDRQVGLSLLDWWGYPTSLELVFDALYHSYDTIQTSVIDAFRQVRHSCVIYIHSVSSINHWQSIDQVRINRSITDKLWQST